VIACRLLPAEAALLRARGTEAGLSGDELVLTGYVSDEVLGALYHACTLFVFASLYEGSGLPILEAMSCGAPVAASSASTTPEILGDDEATFDPFDPSSIAACLKRIVDDPTALDRLAERSRRRVSQYTWEHVAERSVVGYEQALALGGPRRRRRDRLALVSPWPPERSGVADYNQRLVAELSRRVDVDVVVAAPPEHYAPPSDRHTRLVHGKGVAWEQLRAPDRVMYCMGNSHYHGHVYELLRQRPGVVVAHDVRLTGFYGWYSGRERIGDPVGRLRERLVAQYGGRLPAAFYDAGSPHPLAQAALGVYMTREIQEYAEAILVHSRYAAELLGLDRAPLDRAPAVSVIPFAIPDPELFARRPDSNDEELVLSVGVVSEVKGLQSLIEGFGAVARGRPSVRLVIAGPAEEAELLRWRALARECAPEGVIVIPGHVAFADYSALLARATIAVQLRTVSNGEASASVADCLAAGLPTLATDHGWVAELPEGTIATVPVGADCAAVASAIDALLGDGDARRELSAAALAHARRNSVAAVAEAYLRAVDLA